MTTESATYVGIDLHKRRSVVVTMDANGERRSVERIDNSPAALVKAALSCGARPRIVVEATVGWYWAVDALLAEGAEVHLAHPGGLNWGNRRVKNDERDATDLADLLRLGRLPEAYLAPPELRELRELVRYRARLVELRSGLKSQVQALLAKEGIIRVRHELWGVHGAEHLDGLEVAGTYREKLDSLRRLIADYDREVSWAATQIEPWLSGDTGYLAIQQILGVGPVLGAVFIAEIGDVSRFHSPDHLCSWAGLTPKHRESDVKVTRGRITKQGSAIVRWAAVEAVSRKRDPAIAPLYDRVAERRGRSIARVAAARKLLSLVYYGIRDGEIRCLAEAG